MEALLNVAAGQMNEEFEEGKSILDTWVREVVNSPGWQWPALGDSSGEI